MNRQNVTLSIDKDLLKMAKLEAVKNEKSLSEFMREILKERIYKKNDYKDAKKTHERILKKGLNLGTNGHITVSSEELHERR